VSFLLFKLECVQSLHPPTTVPLLFRSLDGGVAEYEIPGQHSLVIQSHIYETCTLNDKNLKTFFYEETSVVSQSITMTSLSIFGYKYREWTSKIWNFAGLTQTKRSSCPGLFGF
jgi:hypothetical protein